METKAELEMLFRVYGGEGHFIEVGPSGDFPGLVEMRTTGDANRDWFGRMNVNMEREFALKLAEALSRSAQRLLTQ